MTSAIDQHFWLVCGLWVGLGNGLLIWFRRQRLLDASNLAESDIKSLARGVALWVLVPCLCLWVLQLSLGAASKPMFLDWASPQREMAIALLVLLWLTLLVWVFMLQGALTLSALMPVLGAFPPFMSTPVAVKAGTILAVAGGLVAMFVPR